MRRKKIGLALLATAMVAGSASAATIGTQITQFVDNISLTQNLQANWGVNPAVLAIQDSAPGSWAPNQGTYVEGDGSLAPGIGGQDFDIEAVYSGFDLDDGVLYFTLVTGFNWYGENASGGPYYVGDFFVDFGAGDGWDLAFDLSPAAPTVVANDPASFVGTLDAYTGSPVTGSNPPQGYASSNPYRITSGTLDSGGVGFSYYRGTNPTDPNTQPQSNTDHNVYNFAYQFDLVNNATHQAWYQEMFTGSGGTGFRTHWTMSCGNDILDMDVPAIPGDPRDPPVVPVPAAAPLGLVGMIALGLFRKVRAKKS